jgi:cbb3-type cytochrome oxidase maturation protein
MYYYTLYIIYIIVSTILGVWGFWWALKNGQFRDQQRARFLPLREEEESPRLEVNPHRYHAAVFLGLIIFWLVVTGIFAVYVLVRGHQ